MRLSSHRLAVASLLASSALVSAPALAQQAPAASDATGGEIIVTAQKRSESLQNVPISIQALGTQKLDQLNISDFKGYTQQLPSVAYQSSGTPGTNVIYMRGVASGGDGNHSGPLPSVGVYLDEQPVTTIGGNLDVHIYDIARIESLAGPQGTLYGASSEAGTIRIITNKPSTKGFEGRVDGEVNHVEHGDWGGKLEGMINAPLSQTMALRVVGFYEKDAGFINNVPGCRAFLPETSLTGCTATNGGIVINNAPVVKQHYNDTEIAGGRAALKVELGDSWTATPTFMYQDTKSHGNYAYDPKVGDLAVQHFLPEYRSDRFWQAALTLEGKLGNWDLTYAGAYLDRKDLQSSDYTDYSTSYDQLYAASGGLAGYFYFQDATGKNIAPVQKIIGTDHFKKFSQELRVTSPSTDRFRVVAGLFYQYQSNDIHQDYQVVGLAPQLSVNGLPGTFWLTEQHRIDRDYAMFGELSYDITDQLKATLGGRAFIYNNSLIGFFGFGRDPANNFNNLPYNADGSSRTGVAGCFTTTGARLRDVAGTPGVALAPAAVPGGPCTNLGVWNGSGVEPVRAQGSGGTYKFNLTYKPNNAVMVYGTVSRGFRPGGINRRASVPPYQPDYLTNFEVGFKTTLAPGVHVNGAVYQQNWNKFQFAYLGANSFTEIHNGPNARIRGVELDVSANRGPLSLNLSGSYTDAIMLKNLCSQDDPTFTCATSMIAAPAGTRLPITPQWKGSGTLRYTWEMGTAKPYAQINATYQGDAASDLRTAVVAPGTGAIINPAALLGTVKGFGTVNFSLGSEWSRFNLELFVENLFDTRGQLSRYVECGSCYDRPYIVPSQPRTIGVRIGAKY